MTDSQSPEPTNPFEALGGGLDLNALMQQAQSMQAQLAAAQEELAAATVEGTAGGGAVTVTVTGTGELSGVTVEAGRFDGGDADDLETLGDLVVAAYRDAKAAADRVAAEKLGPVAGGLPGLGGPGGDAPRPPIGF